ncbi:amino acid permease [Crocinitomicaceae bacterium]|nr:amino acid permease [Crocinitomicaceae bacterium]
MKAQKYTRSVAINMVIANMIGTGIFTSLGFQVDPVYGIPDGFAILVIWILGGIIALCGATVYGEIATTINKSGGEYAFLTELYHPLLGFISGWVSILVGFSAAIAMLALAVGKYFLPLIGAESEAMYLGVEVSNLIAFAVIGLVLLIQLQGVKVGGRVQNYMTAIKLGLILFFLLMPFIFGGNYEPSNNHFGPDGDSWNTILSLPFAGSLVFVLFAYSGWNASTYIVGSLENPRKNLPFSLIVGTLIVTVLYVLLNLVFLYVSNFEDLAGQLEIGNIVAYKVMGGKWGLVFTSILSLALISGVNAMFIAAPRVVQEIGKDYTLFERLGKESKNGAPKLALLVIFAIASIMVFTVPFNELLEFTGVTLGIFALLTVLGVFILRSRKKRSENTVKSFAYPLTPIIFAGFSLWMIYFFASMKPTVLLWLLILIAPAVLLYYSSGRKNSEPNEKLLDESAIENNDNDEVDA